jgi:N-acetylneuraminate lyase
MHQDGNINYERIPDLARAFITNGLSGVFVAGTTGEGMSLSQEERKKLAEAWRDAVDLDFAVIVHVGHNSLADSEALARHAEEEIGAEAIALVPPSYHKPAEMADMVDYAVRVAKQAPETPVYYYHIPGMSGVAFEMYKLLPLLEKSVPKFAGLKFSADDLMDYGQCLNYKDGKYNILFGRDENMLAGLSLGATGFVGATYNVAAPLYLQIIDAFQKQDLETARRLQGQSREMVGTMDKYGFIPALKATMQFLKLDAGPLRLPQRTLRDDLANALYNDLHRIDFFSYCLKV